MSLNDRHSPHDRYPCDKLSSPIHDHSKSKAVHLERDRHELTAEKIMQVDSDYISKKSEERFSDEEIPHGDLAGMPDPKALANKIVKEAAREMSRAAGGDVSAGSDAALAQKIAMHRNDPSAPEHEVVEKIAERIAAAVHHERHPMFVGPNPDKGHDRGNAKLRHYRGVTEAHYVTGGFRNEKNPDVDPEPRH